MRQRILTAILAIPLVLLPVIATPLWSVIGASFLILFLAHGEIRKFGDKAAFPIPIFASLSLLASGLFLDRIPDWSVLVAFVIGIIGSLLWIRLPKDAPHWQRFLQAEWISTGWIVTTLVAFIFVHRDGNLTIPLDFRTPILFGFIPIWLGDTTAMIVGKKFGKHKLWAEVSPGKTWEGALANLFANILGAYGLAMLTGMPTNMGLAIGAATGILGQIGDLFESWLKRTADLKDSGTLFPGHGGLLDRYDSLGFSAIAILAIFKLFGK